MLALAGTTGWQVASRWQVSMQREREEELIFRGEQIRKAIDSYRLRGRVLGGGAPKSLDDLLEDRRGPQLVRHLRERYVDPFTGLPDWETIPDPVDGSSFIGIHSRSRVVAYRTSQIPGGSKVASCVCEWRFISTVEASVIQSTPQK